MWLPNPSGCGEVLIATLMKGLLKLVKEHSVTQDVMRFWFQLWWKDYWNRRKTEEEKKLHTTDPPQHRVAKAVRMSYKNQLVPQCLFTMDKCMHTHTCTCRKPDTSFCFTTLCFCVDFRPPALAEEDPEPELNQGESGERKKETIIIMYLYHVHQGKTVFFWSMLVSWALFRMFLINLNTIFYIYIYIYTRRA